MCKRPNGQGVGICLETFIRTGFYGVGDNRGPDPNGGTYKTSIRFSVDPENGRISGLETDIGSTKGQRGFGGVDVTRTSDGNGGWNLQLTGSAVNGSGKGPMIDYNIMLNVSSEGTVSRVGGSHDGFPSYEIWAYKDGAQPDLIYEHNQGGDWNILRLFGDSDTRVPPGGQ